MLQRQNGNCCSEHLKAASSKKTTQKCLKTGKQQGLGAPNQPSRGRSCSPISKICQQLPGFMWNYRFWTGWILIVLLPGQRFLLTSKISEQMNCSTSMLFGHEHSRSPVIKPSTLNLNYERDFLHLHKSKQRLLIWLRARTWTLLRGWTIRSFTTLKSRLPWKEKKVLMYNSVRLC